MIKQTLITIALFGAIQTAFCQRDSRIQLDTMVRHAVVFESDLSESEATDAIDAYFDSMHIDKEKGKGFIIKKSMGYMLYKSAHVQNVSNLMDYYFVVESRKQKGKDGSTIFIAASNGYNNFIAPDNHPADWAQLKSFAEHLHTNYSEQFKINTEMAALTSDLEKKKRKLDDVLKEKSSLEADISESGTRIALLLEALQKLRVPK